MTEKTQQLPDPVLSRRATAGRFLRLVYGSIVIFLGLFLGWQIIKPLIYTQSAGSVVAPYYVVSTPYTARIVDLSVKSGTKVKEGQVVATVRSPEIDGLRADLLSSIAEQINKEADLRIRLLVATSSLESAQTRVSAAEECSAVIEQNPEQVTSVFRGQVLRECAQANAELARIEAEISETSKQIAAVHKAKNDIEEVKRLVDNAFNEGKQLAPIDGVVANHTANPGQSVTAGTSIVEIYDPTKLYVQWILAADRLIQPQAGAPVYVLDGNRVMRATIKEVYSISEQTQEGATVFSRVRSGQLVRIELAPEEAYPAYMTDVEVRYNYWRFMDQAVELYVDVMTSLGLWREQ
ncbi:HlyD family secretion protein [Orrella daihaiensis]|uniref:HlyD family efflux transporter periplasmic adaptor subunit n=1 Tax=Orrella daihaiensis TaxID=2782176 RepID=A0ABY4AI66_9BURK|nr:HlyD family secretion protein [Orrella daihaiensis]UOD49980.1 HlyD family efflux transporter periplasmic adaptor subunit [Orrella daihaiensis]